jgi:hypothetical protein
VQTVNDADPQIAQLPGAGRVINAGFRQPTEQSVEKTKDGVQMFGPKANESSETTSETPESRMDWKQSGQPIDMTPIEPTSPADGLLYFGPKPVVEGSQSTPNQATSPTAARLPFREPADMPIPLF